MMKINTNLLTAENMKKRTCRIWNKRTFKYYEKGYSG